ncbi:unnamed protein product [Ceratitis capitata]|uniref:(Mediterranean fruit fly) hypothetical protein n=1 Tax=Ceratitis capitata TaxID=7213 RepID=A0A811VBS9_CERCA|nr:unnamed protein product [Ceratitis capitata]
MYLPLDVVAVNREVVMQVSTDSAGSCASVWHELRRDAARQTYDECRSNRNYGASVRPTPADANCRHRCCVD